MVRASGIWQLHMARKSTVRTHMWKKFAPRSPSNFSSLLSIVAPGEGRVAILRLKEPEQAACVTNNGIATLLSMVLGVDTTAGEP
jgi:hypothetical protein